jgi:hypothetical protein
VNPGANGVTGKFCLVFKEGLKSTLFIVLKKKCKVKEHFEIQSLKPALP